MTKLEQKAKNYTINGRAKSLHRQYRDFDRKNGFDPEQTLTEEDIKKICFSKDSKCVYCGTTNKQVLGIDRIRNNEGHTVRNSICSCAGCNIERGDKFEREDYIQIRQLYKISRNFIMTTSLGHITNENELYSLKWMPSGVRCVRDKHVAEILKAMRMGTFDDNTIEVESNTMWLLCGRHRVEAAKLYLRETGKVWPLDILFKDFNGDLSRARKYVANKEAYRATWSLNDHIKSWDDSEGYAIIKNIMSEYDIKDYKLIQYAGGLDKKRIADGGLDSIIAKEDAIRKTLKFMKDMLLYTDEKNKRGMGGSVGDQLIKLRSVTIAVRQVLTDAPSKGNRRYIEEILSRAKNHDEGFMAYAPVFGNIVLNALFSYTSNTGKRVNTTDVIIKIWENIDKMDAKLYSMTKQKRRGSVRMHRDAEAC